MATSSPGGNTNIGMAANLAGLLCYLPVCCLGFVFSVVVVIVEKQSRFLRFHAFQSLLLHGAAFGIGLAFYIVQTVAAILAGVLGILVFVLEFVVFVAILGLMIFMMVKAYNNEKQPLPVIGELAEKWAAI